MSISYPERKGELTLDSNENLFLSEEYYEGIKNEIGFDVGRYPSPTGKKLKNRLADFYELSPEQVVVGNGSDAILDTIYKSFLPEEGTAAHFQPSYEMYSFLASRNERNVVEVPLRSDFTVPTDIDALENVDTVFLCSPNNPTGLSVDRRKIKSMLEKNLTVVIDEAYGEYSDMDNTDLLDEYENLVLVRTFSKAWGLAGIRVGYALTSPEKGIELLDNMLPFNVNTLSLEAANAALDRKEQVYDCVRKMKEEKERLYNNLEQRGFNPLSSQTNFLFCKTSPEIETDELYRELLERDIRIRAFDEVGLKDHVRITIGNEEMNDQLLASLDEVL